MNKLQDVVAMDQHDFSSPFGSEEREKKDCSFTVIFGGKKKTEDVKWDIDVIS